MKNNLLVSIIIPTYNSEKFITACLESINSQHYKNIETIIVDQESVDKTKEIAQKYNTKIISVPKPKFYSPPGKYRNLGFAKSAGEIIMHIDSDMKLTPKLVTEVVEKISSEKFGALIIHENDMTNGFWSRCKALERRCYWGNQEIESARAVSRIIFQKVGGYDKTISSGEDMVIQKKYQEITNVGFCKNLIYHNLSELNFRSMMEKKYSYGKTSTKYFMKESISPAKFFIEEFKCYFKNYKLLLKNPLVTTGMFAMKITEIFFGGLGYIKSLISNG